MLARGRRMRQIRRPGQGGPGNGALFEHTRLQFHPDIHYSRPSRLPSGSVATRDANVLQIGLP